MLVNLLIIGTVVGLIHSHPALANSCRGLEAILYKQDTLLESAANFERYANHGFSIRLEAGDRSLKELSGLKNLFVAIHESRGFSNIHGPIARTVAGIVRDFVVSVKNPKEVEGFKIKVGSELIDVSLEKVIEARLIDPPNRKVKPYRAVFKPGSEISAADSEFRKITDGGVSLDFSSTGVDVGPIEGTSVAAWTWNGYSASSGSGYQVIMGEVVAVMRDSSNQLTSLTLKLGNQKVEIKRDELVQLSLVTKGSRRE